MGTRRANGEGSIYYNKTRECWEGQFAYYDQKTDKPRKKKITGASKTEVAKRGREFLKAMKKANEEAGLHKQEGKTVQEWLESWLTDFVADKVKVKTYERYACSINQHINPHIGSISLANLKTEEVQKMLNALLESGGEDSTGLSARTVNSARRTLIGALNKAVDLEMIRRNPALATTPCKTEKVHIEVLTEAESRAIRSAAKAEGPVAHIVVLLALTTGMRIGEIFGLHWDCVDLANGRIVVAKTLVSAIQRVVAVDRKCRQPLFVVLRVGR